MPHKIFPIYLTLTLLANLGVPHLTAAPTLLPYPILFVTQVPIAADFTTIGSTFGNHRASLDSVGRGGDLWIRYTDGSLKNLTQAAGYGGSGPLTGTLGIAVRDPALHWTGTKAIFSMVIGAPTQQYQVNPYYWQLYEVTGFNYPTQTVTITKVPNQPATFNNVSPIYASDDTLLFTTDRPRNGAMLLYPQLDEYEEAPVVTGLWKLNPANGQLTLLNHAPSGDFTPSIDSYGRVIFTQWDHLQRDQQADADSNYGGGVNACGAGNYYGTFNYVSETSSVTTTSRAEAFPEPRACRTDLLAGTNLHGHNFNQFFPWMINQDGTDSEILNHLGRHEFGTYSERTFTNDPNIIEYYRQYGTISNTVPLYTGMFQIREDPTRPGTYVGVDAPEFGTHASGPVISMTAPPGLSPDQTQIIRVTGPNDETHYREPLPLSDGTLIATHTAYTDTEHGIGFNSNYAFRLKTLTLNGNGYWAANQTLTSGITKTVSYWNPDNLISYTGVLWELNPVEVRARTAPQSTPYPLGNPEQQMFDAANVSVAEFQAYLQANNLALAVSRNVTTRDDLDKQQPYNLRVPGGEVTTGTTGLIYDVRYMQFFQADQLRGLTFGGNTPRPGRRVLAQPLHDATVLAHQPPSTGVSGSVTLGQDGSMAAFIPAQRAMTWQLTSPSNVGVVRERYWLTFQPGEIRVCASCHGLSTYDQTGATEPTNPPQALYDLLLHWKGMVNPPVTDLQVTNAVATTGTVTTTLGWTPPNNALTVTVRYSTSLITEANWANALLLTDTLTGTANSYTANVPYTTGTLYFALDYQFVGDQFAGLSNNAFWPYWKVYLPTLRR